MLIIADYSEFQSEVHPPADQIVIIRAHNGWRPDNYFLQNRADAHQAGCPAVGIYQYLPANVDPAAAASQLLQLIGKLAPDEWLICDLEEGAGNQQSRWQRWRAPILQATSRTPWLYSGLAFSAAHNLQPDWVAAYQPNEPGVPHKLWQDTDVYPWPWGKGDASVFDGNLPEFLASVGITVPEPITPAPPTPSQEDDMPDRLYAIQSQPSGKWHIFNLDEGWRIPLDEGSDGSAATDAPPNGLGLPVIKDKFSDTEMTEIPTRKTA